MNKVFLYGYIGGWRNTAETMADQLKPLEDDAAITSIELHIHSYGGEVFEGNAIYSVLKSCKKPIDVFINGVAASMATIVMMAGRSITMLDNAYLMIHAPSGCVWGEADDMERCAENLRQIEQQMLAYYTARTGQAESVVKEWMSGDTWFNAQKALSSKLINGITSQLPIGVPDLEDDDQEIPEKECDLPTAVQLNKRLAAMAQNKPKVKHNNKFTAMTEEEKAELERLRVENERLQKEKDEREAAEKAAEDAQIEQEVEAAIAAGQITAENKATFVAVGKTSGLPVLKTVLATKEKPKSISAMIADGEAGTQQTSVWEKRQAEIKANLKK